MDPNQRELANPYGMDEHCEHCEELCASRTQVVHGYGDVTADFMFVGEAPSDAADRSGVPFADVDRFYDLLHRLGFCPKPDATTPDIDGAFLTHLTRCRHPERPPTDDEVFNCDGFLTAEIRSINPEILIPVGQRALRELGVEYTTTPADELSIDEHHATRIRGRGFELLPMIDPVEMTDDDEAVLLETFEALLDSDYRQTKGRRNR